MTEIENQRYLKAYYDNEADANRHMSFCNAIAAFVMFAIWMCYVTGAFKVVNLIIPIINIIFPAGILILVSPIVFAIWFKDRLRRKGYKYFVIGTIILVMATLNLILPKHSMIGWALCLVITNHYYNQKVCLTTYIVVLILALVILYGAMFIGEYDPNLLGYPPDQNNPYGAVERYKLLHQMLLDGDNRYLKVFLYYYLSRAAILTLIFLVCNALNKRTYKLFLTGFQIKGEQEKTKTELEVAKEIQLNTLPPEFVSNKDLEILAQLMPAKEVGGDFYDYFFLDKDHIGLVIADVSGKGIPAAMFMMKTITCFKNYVSIDKSPAETLKEVNRTISKNNESKMFVTCFFAIINNKTGEMKFANAGHNPPIVGHARNYKLLPCKTGFILGPLEDVPVEDEIWQLQNGDTVTLYTDGITEARNANGDLYGVDRLLEMFNEKEYSCLVELHHVIKDDVDKFVDGEPQSDDMTYLTMKYHGDDYNFEEHLFKCTEDKMPTILDVIKKFAVKNGFEDQFINNLMVVADEMVSNVVKYAYKDHVDDVFIRQLYNKDKKEFVLTIIDKGDMFDPFLVSNGPLEGDAKDKPVGGLGILIVKKLMSEYAYDYINHKNIVTLKKKF